MMASISAGAHRLSALPSLLDRQLGSGISLEAIVWDGNSAPDRMAIVAGLKAPLGTIDGCEVTLELCHDGIIKTLTSQRLRRIEHVPGLVGSSPISLALLCQFFEQLLRAKAIRLKQLPCLGGIQYHAPHSGWGQAGCYSASSPAQHATSATGDDRPYGHGWTEREDETGSM